MAVDINEGVVVKSFKQGDNPQPIKIYWSEAWGADEDGVIYRYSDGSRAKPRDAERAGFSVREMNEEVEIQRQLDEMDRALRAEFERKRAAIRESAASESPFADVAEDIDLDLARQKLSQQDAEIAELKRQLAEAEEAATNPEPSLTPLKAAHKGGGRYVILQGDRQVVDELFATKAEAEDRIEAIYRKLEAAQGVQ